jgi:hypothetical protein
VTFVCARLCFAENLYLALLLTAKPKETQELRACKYVRVLHLHLHLKITDFVEIILYFKIHKRSDGAVRGEPEGTTTVEAEVASFN